MRLQCRLTTSCTYVNSLSVNHCIVHVKDSLLQCSDWWKLCQTNVDCLRAFHFKHDYLLFLVFVFYFTLLQRNKKSVSISLLATCLEVDPNGTEYITHLPRGRELDLYNA